MSEHHSSSVRDGSQAGEPPWELIAERIDAFAAAWDQAGAGEAPASAPPNLADFVADLNDSDARHVLAELVKLDVERRWQQGCQPLTVEEYAAQWPQLGDVAQLPVDLIYEEFQARMLAGRTVYQDEIIDRFPRQAAALLRLLGGMAVSGSPTATFYADTLKDPKAVRPSLTRLAAFAHLKPGDQIDDFQLITPLGSGAFARVFLARQVSMERMVALKISAAVGSEPQTLAQLDHPHIVRVYDLRHCTDPPSRLLYMEVVPGGTLLDAISRMRDAFDGKPDSLLLLASVDDRLSAVGAPRPESSSSRDWIEDASWPLVVAKLGAEMAEGLAYAHSRGILHRDLKPANVLLSAEAKPKLVDFNVSYNGGRADENPEDTFGGSLAYMSPEQLEACHPLLGGSPRSVRAPADVYALGVVLWELLTGRRPFRDDLTPGDMSSLVKLQRMIETRKQTDLTQLAKESMPDCPPSLRGVLVRALAPDATCRFQSADDLARALRLVLNPRCWDLLEEPKSALGRFITRRPVWSLIFAGLIPNLFTAAFNFIYNYQRIVNTGNEALIDRFNEVQFWINMLAFSLGLGIGTWAALRAFRLFKTSAVAKDPEQSRQVLFFGRFITVLVLIIWVVSGIAFPVAVAWGQDIDDIVGFYMHFFLSLAICGAASTSYPYFFDTAMAVHYFMPKLIRERIIPGPKRKDLKTVSRLNRLFLAIAFSVPLLGVLLVTLVSGQTQSENPKWVLIAVSGGGLLGVAIMLWLERLIALDVEALNHIAVDEPRASGARGSTRSSSRSKT
jgi:serine/threonine protein kinase